MALDALKLRNIVQLAGILRALSGSHVCSRQLKGGWIQCSTSL